MSFIFVDMRLILDHYRASLIKESVKLRGLSLPKSGYGYLPSPHQVENQEGIFVVKIPQVSA